MDSFDKVKIRGIERLDSHVYSVDAGLSIPLQLLYGHRTGIDFYGNFSVGKNVKALMGGFDDVVDDFYIQNRWCAATDIQGIKYLVEFTGHVHLGCQGIEKCRLKRQVCYGIKITIGAFSKAKRDVDVQSCRLGTGSQAWRVLKY
jgi:hypothetical protein